MRLNVQKELRTHEGAKAARLSVEKQLERAVLANLLWENQFYESGVEIAKRIEALVAELPNKTFAAELAIRARNEFKLRHIPLYLVTLLAKNKYRNDALSTADVVANVVQRPDELTELLSIYWRNGKTPIAAQIKKGLARAFTKFDEYSLAKYNRDNPIKLRDVLFLTHPKAKDDVQQALWDKLTNDTLETPDTWEVALSGGADKKQTFERLMSERKLGGLAFIRNLRNMYQAGIDKGLVAEYARTSNTFAKVLPFRYISAARAVPQWEDILEPLMLKSLDGMDKLKGRTALLVDTSGSMTGQLSQKSDLNRLDAASALAILLREISDNVDVIAFNNSPKVIPPRRGFALRDAIGNAHGGTNTGLALTEAAKTKYDRTILITDEQSHDSVKFDPNLGKVYVINVGSYKNSIAFNDAVSITGFSESILTFINEYEKLED